MISKWEMYLQQIIYIKKKKLHNLGSVNVRVQKGL